MARYTGPVCRLCRREGEKLFLKSDRCLSPKCAMEEGRRPEPPGMRHFGRRRQQGDYKNQLREKQKARRFYCVSEKQFANYYKKAAHKKGVTGDNLFQLLESRLDNIVYRLGYGKSRAHARQLVCHGHFSLNGRPVNIPSILLHNGDVIQIKEQKRKKGNFRELLNVSSGECRYPWLEADYANLRGTYKYSPQLAELDHTIQPSLIVEFYSR